MIWTLEDSDRRDSRGRQPEFTQVDIEMSFVHTHEVLDMMEDVMSEVFSAVGIDAQFPLERMQYADAMENYGSDRPDLRFDMKLVDVSDFVKDSEFKVFSSTIANGGVVKAINAKGAGDWSRADTEKLATIATENGAKGLAFSQFFVSSSKKFSCSSRNFSFVNSRLTIWESFSSHKAVNSTDLISCGTTAMISRPIWVEIIDLPFFSMYSFA